MARIRFEGVQKRFGDTSVVDGLDLTIEDGEFFTFLGPSGCGKSTLLHLIAGIETPSSGKIYFDDELMNALAPGKRDVAMVFQSYALYPHMSVYENLAFPLKNKRVPRAQIELEVERIAAMLSLEPLLQRRPKELSGGQRQRVALGRALIRRPRVFLMDEPLSNLDARLRLEMREELKRLHDTHRITTVYVTHDQEEALALSERIAILEHGRIQQCGTPEEVYKLPANLFVASFIGSLPMNLLDGELFRDVAVLASRLAPHANRKVTVGVRPAEVQVHADSREGTVEAEVLLIEPTGSELWVVGLWKGQRIKGRAVPGERLVKGTRAFFAVPPEHTYVFDGATGERVA